MSAYIATVDAVRRGARTESAVKRMTGERLSVVRAMLQRALFAGDVVKVADGYQAPGGVPCAPPSSWAYAQALYLTAAARG